MENHLGNSRDPGGDKQANSESKCYNLTYIQRGEHSCRFISKREHRNKRSSGITLISTATRENKEMHKHGQIPNSSTENQNTQSSSTMKNLYRSYVHNTTTTTTSSQHSGIKDTNQNRNWREPGLGQRPFSQKNHGL